MILRISESAKRIVNGSFPLPDSDSDSDSDLDSKPYGYIVLCRTCFHWLRFRFGSLSQMVTVPKDRCLLWNVQICRVILRISESVKRIVNGSFHCRNRIKIRSWTRVPNPMATRYYAEHVSTDSDSDSDPFPIVSAQYKNLSPSLNPNPSPAMEISHNSNGKGLFTPSKTERESEIFFDSSLCSPPTNEVSTSVCHSVHGEEGVCLLKWGGGSTRGKVCIQGRPPGGSKQAGGTHPTGVHDFSLFRIRFCSVWTGLKHLHVKF